MCREAVRVGSTARTELNDGKDLERFLAKKLKRHADYVDAEPKLAGPMPPLDDIEKMDDSAAWHALRIMRWPDSGGAPTCPKCGHVGFYTITTRMTFKCKSCAHQFSELSGTAFASFKKGRKALLLRIATAGASGATSHKTTLDVRRRLIANGGFE